jgi:EAL domain-containing protein (putative c-di-GMP-specific phosphodiesterase class I)
MAKKPAPQAGVRRALNQKQLELFYQPIHELHSRKIVAAEALLRARRRTGEIRSGEPIAAGAEVGPDLWRLDSWMVQRAFRDSASWNGIRLHVNLSPREFEEGSIAQRLQKLAVDVSRLSLEITETATINKPKRTQRVLEQLRALNIRIWLDDFGTGHSSISHLLHFALDGLKIPGTFVKGLASDKRSQAITKAIIDLAHDLEMEVIAEGIETEDQLAFLDDAGCEYIQGFLFSEPMPLADFEAALGISSSRQ